MESKADLEQEARPTEGTVRGVRAGTCRGAGGPEPSKGSSMLIPLDLPRVTSGSTAQTATHNTWLKVTQGPVASLDESPEALRGLLGAEAARDPHRVGGCHLASKGTFFSLVGRAGHYGRGMWGDTAREVGT